MLKLRNKTRGASKVGYIVKAVRDGFEYAGLGDTPIGVVTEVVGSGEMCKIQTDGEAQVYVGNIVSEGTALRLTKEGEGGKAGVAYSAENDQVYIAIGNATQKGRGLLSVAINFSTANSIGGGSGVPAGGSTGQALVKASGSDYDLTWYTIPAGIPDAPSDDIAYGRRNGAWVDTGVTIKVGLEHKIHYDDALEFASSGAGLGVNYNDSTKTITYTFTPPGSYYDGWKTIGDSGSGLTLIPSNGELTFTGDGTYINTVFTAGTFPNYEMAFNLNVGAVKSYMEGFFYTEDEVDTLIQYFFNDAPADNTAYSRRNNSWVDNGLQIDASGGSGTQIHTMAYDERITFVVTGGSFLSTSYSYSGGVHYIGYEISGISIYTGWILHVDGTNEGNIASGAYVNFAGGTGISLAFTDPGSPPMNTVTISLDSSYMNTNYYTKTQVDTILTDYALISWVNSNFDNYDHWNVKIGLEHAISSGDTVEFASAGSGLSVAWDDVNKKITYTFTPPGSYYDGWKTAGDGGSALTLIPSNGELVFTGDTYISTYFTAGTFPDYEMAFSLNIGALDSHYDARYYQQSEIDTMLGDYALISWVNSNFDKYDYWDVRIGTDHPITSGGHVEFAAGGSGLSVAWDDINKKITYTFTPQGSYYDGWKTVGDSGSALTTIPSNGELTFTGDTYITTVFTAGTFPDYEMAITLNTTTLDTRYYTQSAADAKFATITYVNGNFDDYNGWDLWVNGASQKTVTSGDPVKFMAGSNINLAYASDQITISVTGISSYSGWYVYINSVQKNNIASGLRVDFIDGTYTNVTWDGTGSPQVNKVAFNVDASAMNVAGWFYTKSEIDGFSFATESWVTSNFDDYGGWTVAAGAQSESIGSGDTLTFASGGGFLGVSYNPTTNTITYTVSGITIYTDWKMYMNGTQQASIASGGYADWQEGTGIDLTYGESGSPVLHTITVSLDTTYMSNTYYTKTQIDNFNFATESWVSSNFDNYTAWNMIDAGGSVYDSIESGEGIKFLSGSYISVVYGGAGTGTKTLTFNYTGPVSSYSGWHLWTDGTDNGNVASGQNVNFIGGSNISLSYNLVTGPPAHMDVTIALSSTVTGLTALTATTLNGTTINATSKLYTNSIGAYSGTAISVDAGDDLRVNSDLFVGPLTSPIGTWQAYSLVLGSHTSNERGSFQFHTNVSTDDTSLGAITWYNSASTATNDNVAQINVYRYPSDSDGASFIFQVSDHTTPGTWVDAVQIHEINGIGAVAIGDGLQSPTYEITMSASANDSFTGQGIIGDRTGYTGIKLYDQNVGNMTIFSKRTIAAYGAIFIATGGATPTNRLSVQYNGNVGIGFTGATSASYKLHVSGTIGSTSEITAYASDIRLKKDIEIITSPMDKLNGINGVQFTWRDEVEELGFTPSRKREHGFIAQNVQAHFPEAVDYAPFDREDGKSKSGQNYLTVKPEKLIPLMVEAIKELNAKIMKLEARL